MRLFLPSQTHVFYEYDLGQVGRAYIASILSLTDPEVPVDLTYLEDVQSPLASIYQVELAGTVVGYSVSPTKGVVKNCGSCVYVTRSRWLAQPIGDKVRAYQEFDLRYKVGPLRVYNYASDGLVVGIVKPNRFTEVLDK